MCVRVNEADAGSTVSLDPSPQAMVAVWVSSASRSVMPTVRLAFPVPHDTEASAKAAVTVAGEFGDRPTTTGSWSETRYWSGA